MKDVLLITTGGTIDKHYKAGAGTKDMHIGPSVTPRIIREARMDTMVRFFHMPVMRKDSLGMVDKDRQKIAEACLRPPYQHILITHGTDTMVETAEAIAMHPEMHDKTIVLVGTSKPAIIEPSRATFSIGFALACCLEKSHGVYIAMNGLHPWSACKKNPITGVFEPV